MRQWERIACRQSMTSALAGVRRVDFVRVVEADRPRFFLVGVGHRLPVEREVSPAVALELMRRVPERRQWSWRRPAEAS